MDKKNISGSLATPFDEYTKEEPAGISMTHPSTAQVQLVIPVISSVEVREKCPAPITSSEETPARGKKHGPHFSNSQRNCYQTCPRKYYLKYVKKLPLPGEAHLSVGSATHKSAELGYLAKMKSGREEPLSFKQDVFVKSFRSELARGVIFKEKDTQASLEAQGLELVRIHHENISAVTTPLAVEEEVVYHIPGIDVPILLYIDLICAQGGDPDLPEIRDLKTAKAKYDEKAAYTDFQLALYSAAMKNPRVGFDVLTKTKKPDYQRLSGVISDRYRDHVLQVFREVYGAIKAGIFPAVQPGKYPCTSEGCGYWNLCVGSMIWESKIDPNPEEVTEANGQ